MLKCDKKIVEDFLKDASEIKELILSFRTIRHYFGKYSDTHLKVVSVYTPIAQEDSRDEELNLKMIGILRQYGPGLKCVSISRRKVKNNVFYFYEVKELKGKMYDDILKKLP